MSKVGDYFFEFPASRGTQGSTVILMMTVPARALSRVLATDNTGSTLERSQREINPTRVKKFYQYLVNAYEKKEPFIVPPLVGNCNSEIEFHEIGNTNVGLARFPMDAEIKLFDGQHRAAGLAEFCRNYGETIMIPLMLTHNLPLKRVSSSFLTLIIMFQNHLQQLIWRMTDETMLPKKWCLSCRNMTLLQKSLTSSTTLFRQSQTCG